MSGRRRKFKENTAIVSARIPAWKKEILDLHPDITAEKIFNTGADIVLGNLIHNGRLDKSCLSLLVNRYEYQIQEITEKIQSLKNLQDVRESRQASAQVTVWDMIEQERRIIPAAQFDPKQHKMICEVTV